MGMVNFLMVEERETRLPLMIGPKKYFMQNKNSQFLDGDSVHSEIRNGSFLLLGRDHFFVKRRDIQKQSYTHYVHLTDLHGSFRGCLSQ